MGHVHSGSVITVVMYIAYIVNRPCGLGHTHSGAMIEFRNMIHLGITAIELRHAHRKIMMMLM